MAVELYVPVRVVGTERATVSVSSSLVVAADEQRHWWRVAHPASEVARKGAGGDGDGGCLVDATVVVVVVGEAVEVHWYCGSLDAGAQGNG